MGTAAAAARKKSTPPKAVKRRLKPDTTHPPDTPVSHHDLMTVPEAARYLRRHKLTIYREIKNGVIPNWVYVRFGVKTLRIFKAQLDKYLAGLSAAGAR